MLTFYDYAPAPSPRRARIFLAEKGIEVESVQVDLAAGAQLADEYRAINPQCTVPALKLEDGTVLTENAGIAAYGEAIKPAPNLMGETPLEKGLVATWNARVEFEGLTAVAEVVRNGSPRMAHRGLTGPVNYEQIPALVERGQARYRHFLEVLDERLSGQDYIALDRFSLADITVLCVVDFGKWVKIGPTPEQTNLTRWYEAVSSRPSARL